MPRTLLAVALVWLLPGVGLGSEKVASQRGAQDVDRLRQIVEGLKKAPRGPFERIRWFCRDGSVLPPEPFACREHGGGVQHGELNAQARRLREAGYGVANVLADLNPQSFTGAEADLDALRDLALERFLMQADEGWIFRGARSYRGALQAEDEEAAARRLLESLVADPSWQQPARFLFLRELSRLLPSDWGDGTSGMRQLAGEIAELDVGFAPLRNKIHSLPEANDAERVRVYAQRTQRSDVVERLKRLAQQIEALYDPSQATGELEALAKGTRRGQLGARLDLIRSALEQSTGVHARAEAAASGMAGLRDAWSAFAPKERATALQAIGLLERIVFTAANSSRDHTHVEARRVGLARLEALREALYGSGLLSLRQRESLREASARLSEARPLRLGEYRNELRYLARAADWSARALEFHFQERNDALAGIEPLVREFVPDRIRGSPLLAWNAILETLQDDAAELGQARHEVFGARFGGGLRGLNPGLARGVLSLPGDGQTAAFRRDGIYLLPNSLSDLPPVAGILTRGEGSSLSHVQLLARNMGIPNVVVSDAAVKLIEAHEGKPVVLAASPGGRVLLAADGPAFDATFGRSEPVSDVVIRPDLDKLDLDTWRSLPLDALRAHDSGRIAGPKAANLGELHHLYPGAVPRGVVVPFGAFRRLLDQPIESGGPSVFDWMKQRYAALAEIDDPASRERATAEFLARLRTWIEAVEPGDAFRTDLRASLERVLGPDRSWGVFVRSDTNVEDLPGFTGAGLNLTLPNVVGVDSVIRALGRVWASPFSERAFAWRQSLMEDPEYVFPGVVLLESFDSEKSGVLVTADVDSGDRNWLSVAVSEGVGGAVEGQAAEELRVRADGREVRLLAQASAPRQLALNTAGGLRSRVASGTSQLLLDGEIAQLVKLAAELPERFPGLAGAAADVEFAFRDGRLALLQIRPFVESRRARRSLFLQGLDRPLARSASKRVNLDSPPEGGGA